MRIAHLILSRGFAGTERATAEMCNAHCEQHRVLLIIRRNQRGAGGVSIREWLSSAVEVVEVGAWWPRAGIARALKAFGPDVIHAHLRRATRMLAQIQPAAPTIATLHLTVNGPHFRAMSGLICIAHWQQRDIPPDYAGRVFFINESMVPAPRLAPEQLAALRDELGVGPHQYLIGGVGRLARSKGFDTLIEAFRRAALPNAKLVIIGAGRERRRLQRLCTASISLPGFRHNVKDYYQAFDLFVCPSRREPLGRVVLEALDAGVPVVATRTDGPSEILTAFGGDLVPIDNAGALAARLEFHHAQRTPRTQHDLRAYHIGAVADATRAAYETLIDARAACR